MFPLFWLLRNLGGLARWVGPGRRPGKSGGGRAWEGGEGRGQSQASPTAPDRTRNSSRTEAGETQKDTHTHTQRPRATHSQKEQGAQAPGTQPAPRPGREGPESAPSSSRGLPRLCSAASVCGVRPARLTWPLSLQTSRRGFWTDARPQARIRRWWKVGGAASRWRRRPAGSEGRTGVLRPQASGSYRPSALTLPSRLDPDPPPALSCLPPPHGHRAMGLQAITSRGLARGHREGARRPLPLA